MKALSGSLRHVAPPSEASDLLAPDSPALMQSRIT